MKHLFMRLLFLSLVMFEAGNVGAETKWVKTDPADLADGDVVVIVDLKTEVAMLNDGGTSTNPAVEKVKFNSGDEVLLASEVKTNLQWTVKCSDKVYQFYRSDDTWLYCTSSGVRVGTNSNKNFVIKKVNDNDVLYNTSKNLYIGVYVQGGSAKSWNGYTTTNSVKNTQTSFFKKVTDENDVNLTISSVGYATLYYGDRALMVPDGVTATTYSVTDGKLTESKTYEAGEIIPGGEAVVLKGAAGEYKFIATSTTVENDANNKLKGSDVAAMTTGGVYYYALRAKAKNGPGGPGFYWMDSKGTEPFENGAHKAYLALDGQFAKAQEANEAKSFFLFEEATTGISNAQTENKSVNGLRYNLSGKRVGSSYKGIVIVNGKKFIQK